LTNWIEQSWRDLQVGARSLAKAPGFTLLAVSSLALGIMTTTTIYSVLYAVVLDPFPYKNVDDLTSVVVRNLAAQRGARLAYSVDQFVEIAERSRVFDGVIASTISDVVWTGDGDPQRLRGNHGTFNTFDVMGVPPLLGRTPTASDAQPGAEPVTVLGFQFWQRQFGGDPTVLGRRLRLNGTVRTIIGVMPKRFMWRGADVYLPIPFERGRTVEGVAQVHLLARLKPGVTEAQAAVDLSPIIAELKAREPGQFPDQWSVGLLSFKQTFPSAITRDIWVLVGAVGLLLLIACANVANLLLSRASTRQREMTLRVVLGANRSRLIRQLLTESLLLALTAGAIGAALAWLGLPVLLALVPPDTIPAESEIALNSAVLMFVLIVSVATSVICGLAPALHTARRDLAGSLQEVGRGLAGTARQARIRKTLVIVEVALSLMLLAGSSVLLRTFIDIVDVDLGVSPQRVLTMRVPLSAQRYPEASQRIAFFRQLLPRVATVAGVETVGLNTNVHPRGNMRAVADVRGGPPSQELVQIHQVNADYTKALGARLVTGRLLSEADVEGVRAVALVNERFVRTRLSNRGPLGEILSVPRLKEAPYNVANDSFQIVGVVQDRVNDGLTEPITPEIYVPFTISGVPNLIVVRTQGDPATVTRAIANEVYALDKEQPVTAVMTLDRLLQDGQYATPRFNLVLLSIFATFGLVLAAGGIYGIMSTAVAQERRDIGVRVALGADGTTISRMVLARGSRLLIIGIAIGLAGSIVAARLLAAEVWRIRALDPVSFAAGSLLLLMVGLQACYWPARRAARTDPLIALRQE
jgi:putative ABC transport system permease protein